MVDIESLDGQRVRITYQPDPVKVEGELSVRSTATGNLEIRDDNRNASWYIRPDQILSLTHIIERRTIEEHEISMAELLARGES